MNKRPIDNESQHNQNDILDDIIFEYLSRVEKGESPSIIEEYCAQHSDCASELREIVRTMDLANVPSASQARSGLPPIAANAPREVPEKIGKYTVHREIGHGGMGVVYEAEPSTLGRKVALKVLFPGHAQNEKAKERFHREARVIAKLHHTNIVPLFEFGEDNGQLYLAMQLISGKSLDFLIEDLLNHHAADQRPQKVIQARSPAKLASSGTESDAESATKPGTRPDTARRKRDDRSRGSGIVPRSKQDGGLSGFSKGLSDSRVGSSENSPYFRRVAEIGIEAGFALHHAHERGVIHRDVKPSNLLVDDEGCVWLTDFGLSKADDETMTRTGEIVGTVRYMAPERFKGNCDERSDVYSLALTIYELLTLRRAFETSDHIQMIDQILHAAPRAPRSVRRDIPRDLETVLLKAIDKSPQHRYKTAAMFAEDLLRFLRDEPIHARRASLAEQLLRWVRRNRSLATALAATAFCLLVIAIGAVFFSIRESGLRNVAEERTKESLASGIAANQARELADLREQNRRRSQYFAEMNLAAQRIGAAASSQQVADVTEKWGAAENRSLLGWEWYYLRSAVLDSAIGLRCLALRDVSWSPDDTKVVACRIEGREAWVVDALKGNVVAKLKGHEAKLEAVAWNPKRALIATGSRDHTLRIWDADTWKCLQTFQFEHDVAGIAWSPDGLRLAFVTVNGVEKGDTTLQLLTVPPENNPFPLESSKTQLATLPTIRDFTGRKHLQWSPDATQVAATMSRGPWGRDKKAAIWNVETQSIDRQPFPAASIQWGTNGNGVLHYAVDTPHGEIQLRDGESNNLIWNSTGHSAQISTVRFSPDGQHLLSAGYDNTVRVWDVRRGDQLRICQEHAGGVHTISWNRTGTRIVSSCFGNKLLFWDRKARYRKVVANSPDLESPFTSMVQLDWNPDSQRLATSATLEWKARIHDIDAGSHGTVLLTNNYFWRCRWSPQGTKVVYCGDVIVFLEPVGDKIKWQYLEDNGVGAFDADWLADGSKLAVATGTRTDRGDPYFSIRLYDASGNVVKDMLAGEKKWMALSWNPTRDNLIACASDIGRIQILDASTESIISELHGHDRRVTSLAWNHDGTLLASASIDATIRIWSMETGLIRSLQGHNNFIYQVSWHPDGQRLASAGNDGIKVWDVETGVEILSLDEHRSAPQSVDWSPDGRKLASGDMTGRVIVWDASLAIIGDAKEVESTQ